MGVVICYALVVVMFMLGAGFMEFGCWIELCAKRVQTSMPTYVTTCTPKPAHARSVEDAAGSPGRLRGERSISSEIVASSSMGNAGGIGKMAGGGAGGHLS